MRDRLRQIIQEVVDEREWTISSLAIQPDQVHLLIRAHPYTLPSDLPRLIKGRNSYDVHTEFPQLPKLPSL